MVVPEAGSNAVQMHHDYTNAQFARPAVMQGNMETISMHHGSSTTSSHASSALLDNKHSTMS